MARRVFVALLAAWVGLTVLVPVIGIVAIVMASIALAITLEDELASDEPAGLLGLRRLGRPSPSDPRLDLRVTQARQIERRATGELREEIVRRGEVRDPPIERRLDPTCRLCGWRTLAAAVDAERAALRSAGDEPLVAGAPWVVPGELAFYCDGQPAAYHVGVRYQVREDEMVRGRHGALRVGVMTRRVLDQASLAARFRWRKVFASYIVRWK